MQNELLVSDDHGVTGVVSALAAHDDVGLIGEEIDDLPLAFISPLRPDKNRIWHNAKTRQYCRPLANSLKINQSWLCVAGLGGRILPA